MTLATSRTSVTLVCLAFATACGNSNVGTTATGAGGAATSATAGPSGGTGGTGGTGNAAGSGSSSGSPTASSSSGSMTSASASGSGGGGPSDPGVVGVWTDAPGACPAGVPKVDLTTAAQIASASRGEDAYANDAPNTCYFIHNGTYSQSGVVMYMKVGGTPGGAGRSFIGESRSGVVIHGRASTDDGVGNLTLSNLTFDLTGYSQAGSFNTLTLGTGKDITVDHVTFTGDCATGLKGGHIETDGTDSVLVEACIVEKFGHCGATGHEDHGIYLAGGSNLTFRNNIIRGNSSRGIQMYTQGGQYGTLDKVIIENNRISQNGHGDYEDGIVINAYGTGTIKNVTVQRNIFDHNYYSGIRFAGGLESAVVVHLNTFDSNGAGSISKNRSEINIDDMGGGAGTTMSENIFNVGNVLINDCYDATTLGFSIGANFVHGTIPSGAKGNCVGVQTQGDPQFSDAAQGDYHTGNAAAAAFGAYAP